MPEFDRSSALGNVSRRHSSFPHVLLFSWKYLTYLSVDSLAKLHRKTKSIDVYLDDRGELITARNVWSEVRDNLERGKHYGLSSIDWPHDYPLEAQTREAFCNTIVTDVLNPLVTLRVRILIHNFLHHYIWTAYEGDARSHSQTGQGGLERFRDGIYWLCGEYAPQVEIEVFKEVYGGRGAQTTLFPLPLLRNCAGAEENCCDSFFHYSPPYTVDKLRSTAPSS